MSALVFILPEKYLLVFYYVLGVGVRSVRNIVLSSYFGRYWKSILRETHAYLTPVNRGHGQLSPWPEDSSGLSSASGLEYWRCCCFNSLGIEVWHIGLLQSWGLIINNLTYNQRIKDIICWGFFWWFCWLYLVSSSLETMPKQWFASLSPPRGNPLWPFPQPPRARKDTAENIGHSDHWSPSQSSDSVTQRFTLRSVMGDNQHNCGRCNACPWDTGRLKSLCENALAAYEEAFQLLSKVGSPLRDGLSTFTCISGSQPRPRVGITGGALKKYGYWVSTPRGSDSVSLAWGPGNSVL